MGGNKALLGKLAPPDTSGLLLRERLFRLLDEACKGNLVWVSALAGSGKTTLLASWARARNLPLLWYQLDEGDGDLATFFHYLSLAAGPRRKLPPLSPEHLMAPDLFARRYFTKLFQTWTTPRVLVFDSYHKVAADSPLHAVLDIALDLLPRGSLMAVTSRRDAPPPLSGRYAYATTANLGWDDLRFTASESEALAQLWGVAGELADRLRLACDGWAAMQVLLMRLGADARTLPNPARADLVADYVEREFFARLPEAEREFLPAAALPPFVTGELGRQLTGQDAAGAILERLGREHLLISRYESERGERRYQFHPILREFLLLRLARDIPADAARTLRIRAAQLLEDQGEAEPAAELLTQAGAWDELGCLIRTHAGSLMESGRMAPLRQWLDALPEAVRTADPWLQFWHGSVLRLFDPPAARLPLAQAYESFMAQENAAGAYLAWATIVESFSAPWETFGEIGPWLIELERLQQRHPQFPSPDIEARVLSTGMTLLMAAPYTPLLRHGVARAEALLLDPPSPQCIGPLAWMVVMSTVWRGEGIEQTRTLLSHVSFPSYQVDAFPLSYMLYVGARAQIEGAALNMQGARDWVARGLDVAAHTGIHLADSIVQASECFSATIAGDLAMAEASLIKREQLINPAWALDVQQTLYMRAGILLMLGDPAAAVKSIEGLLVRVKASGSGASIDAIAELLHAQALALDGQAGAARAHLTRPRDFAQRFPSPMTGFQADLVEAYSWFSQNEEAPGLAALRRALAVGRRLNAMGIFPFWLPQMLAPLCRRALEAGIEVDYVRRLVRRRNLLPDSPAIENWPWPVRVYTLGRFAVHRDDVPISFSRKAQKKPLELLKALIALGSRGVRVGTLAEALWEDSAQGASRHALDMAVSRLRKLLGDDRAILVQEGKISLNDKLIWVDANAFERLAGDFETPKPDAEPDLVQRAMDLYTGHFLAGDDEFGWLLGRRDRLRSRYLRLVTSHGSALERLGRRNQAVEEYRRALELEPLAEEIYQCLMLCHLEQGEHAQALETYRRCRELLSIILGVAPSPQTEALAALARG